MSGVAKKLMGTTAAGGGGGGGGGFTAIEDVFSTYLYTGDGVSASDYVVNNGIDLQNEGGLVWIKRRDTAENHALTHTDQSLNVNGFYPYLQSQSTSAAASSDAYGINAFTDTGFTMRGRSGSADNEFNSVNSKMASWTFRKAPRFFDVVTYTGDGVLGRDIAHNLGQGVGSIFVKRLDAAGDWVVYHRSIGATKFLQLNASAAEIAQVNRWNNTEPTDTVFTVGNNAAVNASGSQYVAYLYAHDPLGPSGDGSDGLIACGSYTGNSSGVEINLGWEPQWFLCKKISGTADWQIFDTMRGMHFGTSTQSVRLSPNTSGAETSQLIIGPSPTGVSIPDASDSVNSTGNTYIYIAIRRGPMRVPESGTEVFAVALGTGTYTHTTGFPVDLAIQATRASTIIHRPYDRLRGGGLYLETSDSGPDQGGGTASFDNNTGYTNFASTLNAVDWMFRRAPNFFDVVAYTGDGVAGRTVPHNLGVAPEMMIVKRRDATSGTGWFAYHKDLTSAAYYLNLNSTAAESQFWNAWNSTAPTSSVFSLGNYSDVNLSGGTYIAYLFATLAGVSKVGSYTGNGTSQTIDCGFTSGARFVLLKNATISDNWYVFDTTRGIVAGADPYLKINTTLAEQSEDFIDPALSGFSVEGADPANNRNGSTYIFLAIA